MRALRASGGLRPELLRWRGGLVDHSDARPLGPCLPAVFSMYPLPLRSYLVKPSRSKFLLLRRFLALDMPRPRVGMTIARRTGWPVRGCFVSASSLMDWACSNVAPVGLPRLSRIS